MVEKKCIFDLAKAFPLPDNRYLLRIFSLFSWLVSLGNTFQSASITRPRQLSPPSPKPRSLDFLSLLAKRISAFLFANVFCASSRRLCKRRRRPLCKVIEAQRQSFVAAPSIGIDFSRSQAKAISQGVYLRLGLYFLAI